MRPGCTDLVERDGLNPDLNNAVYENDLKNGVLTAIEDFLSETEHKLKFINIAGLHGLGIIWTERHEAKSPDLSLFLSQLQAEGALQKHIEMIETDRISTSIAFGTALSEIKKTTEIQKASEAHDQLKQEHDQLKQKYGQVEQTNERLLHENAALQDAINNLKQNNGKLQDLIKELQQKNAQAASQSQGASFYIQSLNHGITELLASRRWKIAVLSGEILRKLSFRPKVPLVENFLNEQMEQYRRGLTCVQQDDLTAPLNRPNKLHSL